MKEDLEQLLIDLEEYFDDRADIDYNVDGFRHVPNEAMKFLTRIQEIKEQLNANKEPSY